MLSAKSVIPECFIDSNLFNVLLNFEKESVNHTKGNGTVITKMEKKFSNLSCIGIIDKDKRDLHQIKANYDRIAIETVDEYFILYKHKKINHYIIQIVPEIETWICSVVKRLQINFEIDSYNISFISPKELAGITKNVDRKTDPRFRALFKEIMKKSIEDNFLPVLKLKSIIVKILNDNYTVDINELINA